VRTDNQRAAHEATSHLLGLGCRRPAYLGALELSEAQQEHSTGRLRLRGYHQALEEAGGIAPAIQSVLGWNQVSGRAGVQALMCHAPAGDGSVCGNDDLARGALQGLQELGTLVPDQVSVIGHDNTRESPLTRPPLTTIDPDKSTLAVTVLELLTERIDGYDGPPRVVDTPHRLVERASTVARVCVWRPCRTDSAVGAARIPSPDLPQPLPQSPRTALCAPGAAGVVGPGDRLVAYRHRAPGRGRS